MALRLNVPVVCHLAGHTEAYKEPHPPEGPLQKGERGALRFTSLYEGPFAVLPSQPKRVRELARCVVQQLSDWSYPATLSGRLHLPFTLSTSRR